MHRMVSYIVDGNLKSSYYVLIVYITLFDICSAAETHHNMAAVSLRFLPFEVVTFIC